MLPEKGENPNPAKTKKPASKKEQVVDLLDVYLSLTQKGRIRK
jgi:hypothetical protein